MTAPDLYDAWHSLTPRQRANEIDNGLVSLTRNIRLSNTEKMIVDFMRLVVRLVKEGDER